MDAAKAKYWDLKKSKLFEYGDREFVFQFSQLGYSLVLSGNINEAIEIYKLNTVAFPSSAKAFDDLGEAYHLQLFNFTQQITSAIFLALSRFTYYS